MATSEVPNADALLRVGCACGWEVVGTEDVVVPAVIDHGLRIHNMEGTREQVLANAEPVAARPDPADEPADAEAAQAADRE